MTEGAAIENPASGARTPVLLAVTLVAMAGAMAQYQARHEVSRQAAPPALRIPAMRCSAEKSRAKSAALDAERAGLAKIARYPYAAADGPKALDRLIEAERCYAFAGDTEAQTRLALRAKHWQARIERDYRDHLIRYDRAIAVEQNDEAKREIDFLLAFLADYEGPFVNRLRSEQLTLRTGDRETE